MKKIDLRVSVYTPDDTDPQLISEIVDIYLDYGAIGGGPCNWGDWYPAGTEVISETPIPDQRPTVSRIGGASTRDIRDPGPRWQLVALPDQGVRGGKQWMRIWTI